MTSTWMLSECCFDSINTLFPAVEAAEQELCAWKEKLSGLVRSVQLQERKDRAGRGEEHAEEWYAGIR